MNSLWKSLVLTGMAASLVACAPSVQEPALVELASPAAVGSMAPNLHTTHDGSVLMSWLERTDAGHALRFARLAGEGWGAAHTIAEGPDWFANWADFPAIAELDDGTLIAHWLQKSAPATFAYDVMVTRSVDGGMTWSDPERPHTDGTPTEHGFVSLLPIADDQLLLAWLDGRETGGGGHHDGMHHGEGGPMTLRARTLASDGAWGEEALLDASVCDCCQTAAVQTARGITVAYRNRTDDEMRDIWIVNRRDGGWREPFVLHEDGWHITGCPVNGPAMAARGERVVVAWFTAAEDRPIVLVAFSDDGGDSFGMPSRVDAGEAMGRVGVVLRADGRALVSWLAAVDDGAAIMARVVQPDGHAVVPITLASSAASRASGFPRIALAGNRVVLAWTDAGAGGQVRTGYIENP